MEIRYHFENLRIDLYKTLFRQWRWKIKSSNGKTIDASTESFYNRVDCIDNMRLSNKGTSAFLNYIDNVLK